jgi:hypothetical protein
MLKKHPLFIVERSRTGFFSCYLCNNAKTETFTEAEFAKIGKVIEAVWE